MNSAETENEFIEQIDALYRELGINKMTGMTTLKISEEYWNESRKLMQEACEASIYYTIR